MSARLSMPSWTSAVTVHGSSFVYAMQPLSRRYASRLSSRDGSARAIFMPQFGDSIGVTRTRRHTSFGP